MLAQRPHALVIIDSPAFTLRVARFVHWFDRTIPIVDYVSPSVWAWRAGRARSMSRYIDHVLALLPFEPDVHRKLGGPPCSYVGHPLIEEVSKLRPNEAEAQRRLADPPIVLAMPGSRSGEVARLAGIFGEALALVAERVGPIEVVVPTVPHLLAQVTQATSHVADQAAHRRRAGREARGVAHGAGGARQIRHHHARTRGGRRADGRGLQGVGDRSLGDQAARSRAVLHPRQSGDRAKRRARTGAGGLHRRNGWPTRSLPLLGDTPERRRQIEAFATLDAIMEIGSRAPAARAADIVLGLAPARGESLAARERKRLSSRPAILRQRGGARWPDFASDGCSRLAGS